MTESDLAGVIVMGTWIGEIPQPPLVTDENPDPVQEFIEKRLAKKVNPGPVVFMDGFVVAAPPKAPAAPTVHDNPNDLAPPSPDRDRYRMGGRYG